MLGAKEGEAKKQGTYPSNSLMARVISGGQVPRPQQLTMWGGPAILPSFAPSGTGVALTRLMTTRWVHHPPPGSFIWPTSW